MHRKTCNPKTWIILAGSREKELGTTGSGWTRFISLIKNPKTQNKQEADKSIWTKCSFPKKWCKDIVVFAYKSCDWKLCKTIVGWFAMKTKDNYFCTLPVISTVKAMRNTKKTLKMACREGQMFALDSIKNGLEPSQE